MGMKITFEIDDLQLARAVMHMLVEDGIYGVNAETPDVEREPAKPRAGTAAALLNDASQPGQGKPAPNAVEALIEGMALKRAQTTTLAEGAKGKDGDYVMTESGEEGIIAACYRGKAILEFEDGSAEVYDAPSLTLVPSEESGDEETEAAGIGDDAGSVIDATKANVLKDKANELVGSKKASPDEVFKLLGGYGAAKFTELPAHAFEAMSKALDALGSTAQEPEHGF